MEKREKPKTRCPGCGKDFISLNIHLAKSSEQCAIIRAQRLTNVTSGLQQNIPLDPEDNTNQIEKNNIDQMQPQAPSDKDNVLKLIQETDTFANRFDIFLNTTLNDTSITEFDRLVSNFIVFLFEANNQLPDPKNPAITFYRKRKEGEKITWIDDTKIRQIPSVLLNVGCKERAINITMICSIAIYQPKKKDRPSSFRCNQ